MTSATVYFQIKIVYPKAEGEEYAEENKTDGDGGQPQQKNAQKKSNKKDVPSQIAVHSSPFAIRISRLWSLYLFYVAKCTV